MRRPFNTTRQFPLACLVLITTWAVAPAVGVVLGEYESRYLLAGVACMLCFGIPCAIGCLRAGQRSKGPVGAHSDARDFQIAAALGAAVLAVGLICTSTIVAMVNKEVNDEARARFDELTARLVSTVERTINQPLNGLMGARGVYCASISVSRSEFEAYVRSRDVHAEFPIALGLGYIERVDRSRLGKFVADERQDGDPEFDLRGMPGSTSPLVRDDLYVIKHCFPREVNASAWGLDIGSEAVQREAAERAMATGRPTITGRCTLVQDDSTRTGFLYMIPIFANGAAIDTPEQRREAMRGLVYAPIVLENELPNVVEAVEGQLDFELFDGLTATAETQLFDFDGHLATSNGPVGPASFLGRMFFSKNALAVGGHTWLITTSTTQSFESRIDRSSSIVLLVGGLTVSILASGLGCALSGGRARARSCAAAMTVDLQRAKETAEAALREAQGFRATLDRHSILSVTDREGCIIDVNANFCQVTGYSRDELIGHNHRLLGSGQHPKSLWTEMWRTVATGEAWRGEICNRCKDGRIHWLDTIIAPFLDAEGKVVKYISIRSDITARKALEERTLHDLDLLNEIGDVAGVGGWEMDLITQKIEWTRQTRRIHEVDDCYEPELASALQFYPASARSIISQAVAAASAGGGSWDLELPFVTAKGRSLWVRAVGRAQMRGNKAVRLFGAFQDITAAQDAKAQLGAAREAAEGANQAKSAFLAAMSHEIRTPLTAILGFADLLRDDSDTSQVPEKRLQAVETIRSAGSHLLSLINDILDLSKIEAGKMSVEQIDTSLMGVLREIDSLIRPRALLKGLDLRVSLASPVPQRIISDPTRLRQIIMNLLGNAIKFTDSGYIAMTARVIERGEESRLVIDVEDTGPGMNPDQASRLFHEFGQADETVSRKFGGTGLGLTISRKLAALMGGRLDLIRTAPEKGSCFRLELPLRASPGSGLARDMDAVQDGLTPVPTPSPSTLEGRHILLAEDGLDNQRLISFHLRKAGATVDVADNGRVALEMIRKSLVNGPGYDLLLTDMQMPEMDGYALARALRSEGNSMSIVALTAHAMNEDRTRCIDAGCDDYASKPIDRERLIATCAAWIVRKADVPSS